MKIRLKIDGDGLILYVNQQKSKSYPIGRKQFFHTMSIDEKKVDGVLMFRLEESTFEIIVEEKIVKAINDSCLKGINVELVE